MPTEKLHLEFYEAQIAEATGAPVEILPILESIMREEIFHSTLDWQTAAQFRTGARKAHRIYEADAAFYQAEARRRRASFRVMGAEQALREAREPGADPAGLAAAELAYEQARLEEAAARAALSQVSSH